MWTHLFPGTHQMSCSWTSKFCWRQGQCFWVYLKAASVLPNYSLLCSWYTWLSNTLRKIPCSHSSQKWTQQYNILFKKTWVCLLRQFRCCEWQNCLPKISKKQKGFLLCSKILRYMIHTCRKPVISFLN